MSDIPLGQITDVPPDVPADTAREQFAAFVRNGLMSADEANGKLAARGAAPLNANSTELAQAEYDRLMKDPNAMNDPATFARLTALGLRIEKGGGKLTDKDSAPADYRFNSVFYRSDAPIKEVQEYHDGLAKLASDLKLPEPNAKAIVEEHLNAVQRSGTMTTDELEAYGRKQESDLFNVLGSDAETRLKAASVTLKQMSGRDLDLLKIVRSNGATVAVSLLFQAETWAATKGRR